MYALTKFATSESLFWLKVEIIESNLGPPKGTIWRREKKEKK